MGNAPPSYGWFFLITFLKEKGSFFIFERAFLPISSIGKDAWQLSG
jgi:hypothetical protein